MTPEYGTMSSANGDEVVVGPTLSDHYVYCMVFMSQVFRALILLDRYLASKPITTFLRPADGMSGPPQASAAPATSPTLNSTAAGLV